MLRKVRIKKEDLETSFSNPNHRPLRRTLGHYNYDGQGDPEILKAQFFQYYYKTKNYEPGICTGKR